MYRIKNSKPYYSIQSLNWLSSLSYSLLSLSFLSSSHRASSPCCASLSTWRSSSSTLRTSRACCPWSGCWKAAVWRTRFWPSTLASTALPTCLQVRDFFIYFEEIKRAKRAKRYSGNEQKSRENLAWWTVCLILVFSSPTFLQNQRETSRWTRRRTLAASSTRSFSSCSTTLCLTFATTRWVKVIFFKKIIIELSLAQKEGEADNNFAVFQ